MLSKPRILLLGSALDEAALKKLVWHIRSVLALFLLKLLVLPIWFLVLGITILTARAVAIIVSLIFFCAMLLKLLWSLKSNSAGPPMRGGSFGRYISPYSVLLDRNRSYSRSASAGATILPFESKNQSTLLIRPLKRLPTNSTSA